MMLILKYVNSNRPCKKYMSFNPLFANTVSKGDFNMFFKFQEDMRRIFLEDIDKHNVLAWIIYHTNFQTEFNGLQKYQCYITTRNVAEDTKIHHTKVQRILKNLVVQGFISYTKKSKSKHESSIIFADFIAKDNTVNNAVVDTVDNTVVDTVTHLENTILEQNDDTVVNAVKNTVNTTVNDTSSKNISNIYSRVITRLNQKTSKRFRASSKRSIDLIQARINEGYKEEDFYKVIDIKCASWLHDKVMNQYLRPETLFGNKFESYLNEIYFDNTSNVVPFRSREL